MLRRTHGGESIDGKYVIISDNGGYYNASSSDYGKTFTRYNTNVIHRYIAISGTGQYLTVAGREGIQVSSDYGNTWKVTIATGWGNPNEAYSCAMSSSGKFQIACIYNQQGGSVHGIYTSSDYGNTWLKTPNLYNRFTCIVMSSSGQHVYGVSGWYVFCSHDYGKTWTSADFGLTINYIDVSSDGSKMTAVGEGYYYTSFDYGITWTTRGYNTYYKCVSMSSSSKYQVACDYTGIYLSSDWGDTFAMVKDGSFSQVSMSATGKHIAVGTSMLNGKVLTSSDYGRTWSESHALEDRATLIKINKFIK